MLASHFVKSLQRSAWPRLVRGFASGTNYVSKDIGETQYEQIETKIRPMDPVPSWHFKFDDGKYHILRSLSDERYLLMSGVLLPKYAGSNYFSMEKNGTIFHVFNADRMVKLQ